MQRHRFEPIYCDVLDERLVATCAKCGRGGVLRLWRSPSKQGNAGWAHRSRRYERTVARAKVA